MKGIFTSNFGDAYTRKIIKYKFMSLGACNLLTCPAVVISKKLYIFHVQQVVLIRFVTQSNLNFRICCLPTNLHQIAQNYTRTEQWSEKKQSTWADGIVALVFSTQSGSARDNCLLSNELLTAKRLPIVNDISSSTSLLGFFATNNNFWRYMKLNRLLGIVGRSWWCCCCWGRGRMTNGSWGWWAVKD